jgi:AAA15 family ATPase/GTPase
MIIRFAVQNLLSFNERTEFNMLTKDVRRLPDHVHKLPKIDLLKSAVIYGANGAGKSNLIMAIQALSKIVSLGQTDIVAESALFRLANTDNKPTTLEIEFIIQKIAFGYKIVFYDNIILEESLTILNFDKKENEIIFNRKLNKKGKKSLSMAPKYLKTDKDKLLFQVYEEDLLEDNKPLISLLKDKKYKEIKMAYEWFENALIFIFPGTQFSLVKNFIDDARIKDFTNRLISLFDTGIKEIDVQTIDFDQFFGEDNTIEKDRILKKIKSGDTASVGNNAKAIAMIENGKPVVKKAVSYHHNTKGKKVRFELFEESDGTLRLIDFIPILYVINKAPVTILIDEIDQSIHPSLLKEFISIIQNNSNKKGQVIFTTHESNLLDLELFRQDEIWFAEKNNKGESHFYPLSDYNIRLDLDIRKGYLSGRFGAIPFLANLKDLSWEKYIG